MSWGGEDDASPKFGTVFTSIDFEADVTADKQVETKAAITELVKQLAVVSFDIEYTDPVSTFVESDIFYQINPQLTSLSNNAITTTIDTVVSNYFAKTLGKFKKSFPPIIDDGLNDTMLTCLVVELYSPILSTITRPLAALTTCSFLDDFATPAVTCVSLIIRQVTPSTSKLLLRTT